MRNILFGFLSVLAVACNGATSDPGMIAATLTPASDLTDYLKPGAAYEVMINFQEAGQTNSISVPADAISLYGVDVNGDQIAGTTFKDNITYSLFYDSSCTTTMDILEVSYFDDSVVTLQGKDYIATIFGFNQLTNLDLQTNPLNVYVQMKFKNSPRVLCLNAITLTQ